MQTEGLSDVGWFRGIAFSRSAHALTAGLRRDVPLTPQHAGSLNAMWEGGEWGRFGVEALLNVRQTRDDPLILPTPRPDGRWTVDAWAPLEGRVINGGIRLSF